VRKIRAYYELLYHSSETNFQTNFQQRQVDAVKKGVYFWHFRRYSCMLRSVTLSICYRISVSSRCYLYRSVFRELYLSHVLSSVLAARTIQSRQSLPELRCKILQHDLDQSVKVILVSPAPILACTTVVEYHWPRVGYTVNQKQHTTVTETPMLAGAASRTRQYLVRRQKSFHLIKCASAVELSNWLKRIRKVVYYT